MTIHVKCEVCGISTHNPSDLQSPRIGQKSSVITCTWLHFLVFCYFLISLRYRTYVEGMVNTSVSNN